MYGSSRAVRETVVAATWQQGAVLVDDVANGGGE